MTLGQGVLRVTVLVTAALLMVTLAARGVHPVADLVALPVAVIALRSGPRSGLLAGLVGGWILDLLPPGSTLLGWSALTYAVAGALVGRFRRHGLTPWVVVVANVVLVSAIVDGCSALLALARGGPVALPALAVRWAMTATVALLLGPALARWDGAAARSVP